MASNTKTFGCAYTRGVIDANAGVHKTPYEKQSYQDAWYQGQEDYENGRVIVNDSGEWELVND